MSSQQLEYADLVVVGGGPAGSTVASLTAMQGHRVIVLEKGRFPRHQIGESLLPSTIHGICKLTGVYDEIEKAGFTVKHGGSFRWGANPETWTFSFSVSPKMAASSSFAYQVERSKFDKILLDHARGLGAEVRENCTVTGVTGDNDRVRAISYRTADGGTREIAARYVVDASGNKSRIYRSVGGSRQYSEFFRSVAVYGYFDGGKRLPPPNSGNILSAAFESGWCWYIPLSPTLTSVGVVVRRELASRIQGDPEGALLSFIAECPIISEYLKGTRRITEGDYGKVRVRRDYSYLNTRFWRPGMALIGDAACFIDPVFSSGVHLATYSALLLGRSINSVLAGVVDEEIAFREFEQRYKREFSVFYQYLMCFYDMHVDADSYFWSAKKITQSAGPDIEAFVNLVGGVASGEFAFGGDNKTADRIKDQSRQFSESVDELVASGQTSMLPVFKSDVVSQVVSEGARIQAHTEFGEYAIAESPMFEKGLIASPDGMFWKVAE